jgi:hypothetical protein
MLALADWAWDLMAILIAGASGLYQRPAPGLR